MLREKHPASRVPSEEDFDAHVGAPDCLDSMPVYCCFGPSLAEHCSYAQDGNTPVRYSKVRWEDYKTINVISICLNVGRAQIPSATADTDGHESMDNCSSMNKLGILCAHSHSSRVYQLTPLEANMAIEPEQRYPT